MPLEVRGTFWTPQPRPHCCRDLVCLVTLSYKLSIMNDPPDRISDTFHEPLVTSVTGSRYEGFEATHHEDHRSVGVLGTSDMSFSLVEPASALGGSQTLQATIPHRVRTK